MSVDFGKARQVYFGKSPLTKAITSGAFGVSTTLTMDQVRDAAALTCREYPVKKRLLQSMAPRIVQRKSGHEVIAYGALTQRKTPNEGPFKPCSTMRWTCNGNSRLGLVSPATPA